MSKITAKASEVAKKLPQIVDASWMETQWFLRQLGATQTSAPKSLAQIPRLSPNHSPNRWESARAVAC